MGDRNRSRVLVVAGLLLIVGGILAVVVSGNVPGGLGLALLGLAALLVAELSPRLTGQQEFAWNKLRLNVADARRVQQDVVAAEAELASGIPLASLSDIDAAIGDVK